MKHLHVHFCLHTHTFISYGEPHSIREPNWLYQTWQLDTEICIRHSLGKTNDPPRRPYGGSSPILPLPQRPASPSSPHGGFLPPPSSTGSMSLGSSRVSGLSCNSVIYNTFSRGLAEVSKPLEEREFGGDKNLIVIIYKGDANYWRTLLGGWKRI